MVPKTQSAKTPVAGPPTTGVRKPLANTPCNNAPPGRPTCSGRATLLPAWPLNGTCVSHKSPLFRSWIYPNETNETHYRYGECVFSYDECPICTLSRYDSGHVTETKTVHHVSPHTQPSIPMPGQPDRIQRRHKCTGISYENVNSCVNPLTKAKLTRSCAGPNPGAIKYVQFTTVIALEETERCNKLALEHHKYHKMRTSEARDVGSHPRPPAKRQGTPERAGACPGLEPGG